VANQKILWIALPNGRIERDGLTLLRLSIYASPRLAPDGGSGRLGDFPDWASWGDIAAATADFEIEVDGTGAFPGRRAPSSSIDAPLWSRLFKPRLPVQGHAFDDYAGRPLLSYPAADAIGHLKEAYQTLVFGSPNELPPVPSFLDALGPFAVELTPDTAANIRSRLRAEQAAGPRDPSARARRALPAHEVVARALLFHSSEAEEPPVLLRPGPEMESLFDFHRAVAQLGDYPALMRRLGLVFDVEFPAESLPAFSPAAAPLRLRARPRWQQLSPVATSEAPLWTAFTWDGDTFAAAARPLAVPELVDGLLNLSSRDYELAEIDVDGAILKQNHAALNVARGLARRAPDASPREAPASLRSAGLALMRRERPVRLHGAFGRAAQRNAELESGAAVESLYAEDLTRGFAVDVWSSLDGTWRSLCGRIGDYHFLDDDSHLKLQDEGFTQTALTEGQGGPPNEMRVHETLWAWTGWSLCAPRPGKSILSGAGSGDAPTAVTNTAQTALAFEVAFEAAPRSLPRLRYGARYRMRARAVDLAGHSRPLATAGDAAAIPQDEARPYLRFEPLGAPEVVLREALDTLARPGESLERLVVRTRNAEPSLDAAATDERTERHLAPPRVSLQASEWHGMLDGPSGRVMSDSATYEMLKERDAAELPLDAQSGMPVVAADTLAPPYLPDPLARGAALRGLPGVKEGSVGRVAAGGLVHEPLAGTNVRPGTATLVEFDPDPAWPRVRGFVLELADGDGPPHWNSAARRLSVFLPKAQVLDVPLSCFVRESDLRLFGMWDWLREIIEGRAALQARDPQAMFDLGVLTTHVAQYALEGGLWAMTPARTLRLVHAVQQPLRSPAPKLIAVRPPASTSAALMGEIAIHGRSTGSLDLRARWSEELDLLGDSGPRTLQAGDHADTIPVRTLEPAVLRNGDRMVGEYLPELDLVRCQGHSHPRHEFGDTKHRIVRYVVSATSRFTDCFAADEPGGFVRVAPECVVDVPASARPAPPALEYIVPTFGWQRHAETNLRASLRRGRGLRVYLRRPWYSSGDGELLGVVLRSAGRPAPTDVEREDMKPYITQWGNDPIWGSASLPPMPTRASFPLAVEGADALALPERRMEPVAVAGHRVAYDEGRRLWFSDIEIESGASYFPFVRLALARYQPSAIDECHLSAVTLGAFAQVAPDRTLIVTYDAGDPDLLHVVVSGFSYGAAHFSTIIGGGGASSGSEVRIEVQQRVPGLDDALGWTPAAGATVTQLDTERANTVLWRGTVRLPSPRLPNQFRVLAREYETHEADAEGGPGSGGAPFAVGGSFMPPQVSRLVYADGIVV
jgi:hypothetical protein